MEPADRRREMDSRYEGRVYSLGELETLDKWREWQANAMAAALLIPAKYLAVLLERRRLTIYGKRMNIPDNLKLDNLCDRLKVSRTAMTLRLRQLGYATVLPASAYHDPTDIECDDDFYFLQT